MGMWPTGRVIWRPMQPPVSPFDAATLAWVAAVVANGGTVSAGREQIVDDLIVGLKSDGLFTKLDRLWLLAAENAPSALTDIIADALATATSSPTFAVDAGYTGDGATSYVDSNFNPASAPSPKYVLGDATLFGWSNTGGTENKQFVGYGAETFIYPQFGDTNCYYNINQQGQQIAGNSFETGLFQATKTAVSTGQFFFNGSPVFSDTATATTVQSADFTICALPINGHYSLRQASALGIGAGFNATQALNLYNRLRTYMTAVGVP